MKVKLEDIKAKAVATKNKVVAKTKQVTKSTKDFVEKHPDIALMAVPVIASFVMRLMNIINSVVRGNTAIRAEKWKGVHHYDPSLGIYVETKRPLTSKDAIKLDKLRKSGETTTSALDKMHLLK